MAKFHKSNSVLKLLAVGVSYILLSTLSGFSTVQAQSQSTKIIVSQESTIDFKSHLLELDTAGNITKDTLVPSLSTAATELSRDLIRLPNGKVAIYNGTFNPDLSICELDLSSCTHIRAPQLIFRTANYTDRGAITFFRDFIFLANNFTYSSASGESKGIARYNYITGEVSYFATNLDIIDLNTGPDGLLYGLDSRGILSIFDPVSMELNRSIQLEPWPSQSLRTVAVLADGRILIGTLYAKIKIFSSLGKLIEEIKIFDGGTISDIDLNSEGNILITTDNYGQVALLNPMFEKIFSKITNSSSMVSFSAFSEIPCQKAPSVSSTVSKQDVKPGQIVTFNLNIKNENAVNCPAATIELSSSQADLKFDSDVLTLSGGESGQTTVSLNIPLNAPISEKSFTVNATIPDGLTSNPLTLSYAVIDGISPSIPARLKAVGSYKKILLSWQKSKDNVAVVAYNVYRSTGELIYSTRRLYFVDKDVVRRQRYSYYVRAVDAAGNLSNPSNIATAKVK